MLVAPLRFLTPIPPQEYEHLKQHWTGLLDSAKAALGLYPIVTFQYSSATSYQVFYHIR